MRAFNGVKAEYRSERISAVAFAADSPNRHRHDEIQGNGLSGPYALGARPILANSERVAIEVRDRLHSDRIVERRLLSRHIDYDIDYEAGTLRFREPILSRSSALDPQLRRGYESTGSRSARHAGPVSGAASTRSSGAATAVLDSTPRTTAGRSRRPLPSVSLAEIRAECGHRQSGQACSSAPSPHRTAWRAKPDTSSKSDCCLCSQRDGRSASARAAAPRTAPQVASDARAASAGWSGLAAPRRLSRQRRPGRPRALSNRTPESRPRRLTPRRPLADGLRARSKSPARRHKRLSTTSISRQTAIRSARLRAATSAPVTAQHRIRDRASVVGAYEIATSSRSTPGPPARLHIHHCGGSNRSAATSRTSRIPPASFAAFGLPNRGPTTFALDASVDANRRLAASIGAGAQPLHPSQVGFVGGSAGDSDRDSPRPRRSHLPRQVMDSTGRAESRGECDRYGVTARGASQSPTARRVGGPHLVRARSRTARDPHPTSISLAHRRPAAAGRGSRNLAAETGRGRDAGTRCDVIPLTSSAPRARAASQCALVNHTPKGVGVSFSGARASSQTGAQDSAWSTSWRRLPLRPQRHYRRRSRRHRPRRPRPLPRLRRGRPRLHAVREWLCLVG